jgi:glycosyltransferase domain-containing protein
MTEPKPGTIASLNDLSLVMLTYKRPAYVARNLRFWSGRGPRIIVIDGSPDAIDPSALQGLSGDVSYHHAPVSYRARLDLVESKLTTPYVALLADDDFYLPSGLAASIEFMEVHPDYAACIGRPLGFGYNSTAGVFGVAGVYSDMYKDYRVVAETPGLRMLEHMGRYMPSTIYAVLRSANWRAALGGYIRKEFPVFAIGELQIELAIAYLGKSAVLPVLSWLKSTELEQIEGPEISLRRVDEFHDLWPKGVGDPGFRSAFVSTMADALSDIDQRPNQVVAGEIEAAMDAYVDWCGAYFRSTISFFDAREYLKRVLPGNLSAAITRYLRAMRQRRAEKEKKPGLIAMGGQLRETGTSVNMSELEEISAFIHDFHADIEGSAAVAAAATPR